MSKQNFYTISDRAKEEILQVISSQEGIPAYAVEKDWWIVKTLEIIFESEVAKHLVFKGGTSLSKGWELIQRFSEDIDLAIDRSYFGFDQEVEHKDIDKLRKKAGKYIDEKFCPSLAERFKELGLGSASVELEGGVRSDRDRSIMINYNPVIKTSEYLQPRVKIEFSCRSLREPTTNKDILSLVRKNYSDFEGTANSIPTVNPERTFLEKIFLLHEEFQRPEAKIRKGERLSRHLYDVAKLSKTPFAEIALAEPSLYQTIVRHRRLFNQIPGIDYDLHIPKVINPIPKESVIDDWARDYKTMREEMIYDEEAPDFDELIATLNTVKEKINGLEWSLE